MILVRLTSGTPLPPGVPDTIALPTIDEVISGSAFSRVTIGRSNKNTNVLDCPVVPALFSHAHHSTITLVAVGMYRLKDHCSLNGTFLNGHIIPWDLDYFLKLGDIIEFGGWNIKSLPWLSSLHSDRVPPHETGATGNNRRVVLPCYWRVRRLAEIRDSRFKLKAELAPRWYERAGRGTVAFCARAT